MSNSKFAMGLVVLLSASPAAMALDVTIVSGQTCPSGSRLMTFQEAQTEQNKICHSMGQWFIGRLAGNGSIDGPGYNCQIRPSDDRALTNAVCTPVTAPPWSINAVHNNSGREVTVYVPIQTGQTISAANALSIGRLALITGDFDAVKFSEARQHPAPCGPFWRVRIVSQNAPQNRRWSYFFKQSGTIEVTVNADNSLNIVPSAGGQVIAGDGDPRC